MTNNRCICHAYTRFGRWWKSLLPKSNLCMISTVALYRILWWTHTRWICYDDDVLRWKCGVRGTLVLDFGDERMLLPAHLVLFCSFPFFPCPFRAVPSFLVGRPIIIWSCLIQVPFFYARTQGGNLPCMYTLIPVWLDWQGGTWLEWVMFFSKTCLFFGWLCL